LAHSTTTIIYKDNKVISPRKENIIIKTLFIFSPGQKSIPFVIMLLNTCPTNLLFFSSGLGATSLVRIVHEKVATIKNKRI